MSVDTPVRVRDVELDQCLCGCAGGLPGGCSKACVIRLSLRLQSSSDFFQHFRSVAFLDSVFPVVNALLLFLGLAE